MATTFIIPEYTSLERGPVASIQGLAANEAAAADELGELFSMAVASRVPLVRVNLADVIIVPLVEPGEGQRCDLQSTLFPQVNACRAPSPSPQPSPWSWPRAHDTLLACLSSPSVISLLAFKLISCSSLSTTCGLATV